MSGGREPLVDGLGVDIGGVVVKLRGYREDEILPGDHPREMPGARAALGLLRDERFGNRIYLVSKCGPRTEAVTRRALIEGGLCKETGVGLDRAHFCRERRDKATICEQLGLTHFVDDRLEVLSYLTTVPHRYLFNGRTHEIKRFRQALASVTAVADWGELVRAILG